MERWVVESISEYINIYNGNGDLECYRFKKKEMYNELVDFLTKGMDNDITTLGDYYRFFLANVYIYVKELKNVELGFNLAKEVADRGNDKAQVLVAKMLEEGKGVKKNEEESFKYYKLAAAKDNMDAIAKVKSHYSYGISDEDQKEYQYWLEKSAELGDYNDLHTIILNYKFQENYEKVYELCVSLINKVTLNEKYYNYSPAFKGALIMLSEMYIKGLGTEKNTLKGLNILETLAKDDGSACEMLGFMYLDGDGVDKDYDKAIEYLKKAAKDYCYTAQNKLEELGIEY